MKTFRVYFVKKRMTNDWIDVHTINDMCDFVKLDMLEDLLTESEYESIYKIEEIKQ